MGGDDVRADPAAATGTDAALPLIPARAADRMRADRQLLGAVDAETRVLFLDIETTGLSRHYDEITIVGYMAGGRYDVHIQGDDPSPLLAALEAADTLVTFNGTLFDVPFLLQTFAAATVPPMHIDLRYATRRLGLSGGQKALEQTLDIDVREGLRDIDGAEAVLLWHRYLRGDLDALKLLIRYNLADVLAMGRILDHVVDEVGHRDLLIQPHRFGALPLALLGHSSPDADLPPATRLARRTASFGEVFGRRPAAGATVVGIDLTGSERKPSGVCVLRGDRAETALVGGDDALVEVVLGASPSLVSIDSPLCLPRGRLHVGDDDPTRAEFGIMRVCERTLKRRGINVYPSLLPSMQKLTERGIDLAKRLRALGIPVIESYPGAAQDIMGIPRKGAGVHWLQQGLAGFGIKGDFVDDIPSHDELDAITSALVGTFHLDGQFEALGGEGETALIVPDLGAAALPLVIGLSGRIAAGKTTAARWIEALGFSYTRFSLVIDDEIRSMGLSLDRPTRQRIGMEIHDGRGQAWLCGQTLARVGDSQRVVVDGLRWPEDHAYFVERFGNRFVHLHVRAPAEERFRRTGGSPEERPAFDDADAQPVEAMIDALGLLATRVIENASGLEHFELNVARIVAQVGSEAR